MKPFRMEIPESELEDLRRRLAATRWAPELEGVGWERGVPQSYLRELVQYWGEEFDWRAVEERVNRYPQSVTEIDGATVHFLHVRSPEPGATPIVLSHGWPGSFLEFLDVIGPLTDPRSHGGDPADAFHVVVPSLPGFGFSGPLTEPGWGIVRIAQAWAELMARLGYDRYIAHGTDFGSWVSQTMAAVDPEHALGAHVTFLITPPPGPDAVAALTEAEARRLAPLGRFLAEESGYMKIQATRPSTLGHALTDSPVGQLAWIIEKFKEWTDSEKLPEEAVDRDKLLADISLYWFTRTAGSAAQLYFESAAMLPTSPTPPPPPPPIPAPIAVSVFPADPSLPIRAWADEVLPNIVQWTEHDRGGHFPALEEPDLVVDDIRRFRRTFG